MADPNEEVADYEEQADGDYNEEDYAEQTGQEGEEELDPDAIQKRVQEMENELHKLTSMQEQVSGQLSSTADKVDETSM
ncbi:hypothetical protein EON65_07320 [archaeon]|nr:MAG: hypothetical protein EON65_07320 [archaeon]